MNATLIEQYRQLHAERPDYGSQPLCLREVAALIQRSRARSVLDFGAGKQSLAVALRRMFGECVIDAYDPAIPGIETIPAGDYDLVCATDVLEHLDPDDFQQEFAQIAALRPEWLFFRISCRHAFNSLPDGTNCHTMVRSPQWWRETLLAHFPEHIEYESAWHEGNRHFDLSLCRKLSLAGQRVAVIGNGPTALENKEDIDAFDVVLRCNNFQIGPGFEKIGSRTDIWCLPTGLVAQRATKASAGGARMVLVLDEDPPRRRRRTRKRQQADMSRLRSLFGRKVEEDITTVSRVRAQLAVNLRPTTGISAIAWALNSAAAEIFLCGFSFSADEGAHYFNPAHTFSPAHDRLAELEWLKARADDPRLRYDDHIARKLGRSTAIT